MSKKGLFLSLLIITILTSNVIVAQDTKPLITPNKKSFFIEGYIGTQVSGIRKEDYVKTNFSPYIQISAGKILSQSISVNINFQGPYFNYIGDNHNHNYQFFGSELIISLSSLVNHKYNGPWKIYLFTGPGVLFNNYLNKTNLCLSGGIINEYKINTFSLKIKISAIGGFKIYQHDKDILTNLSLGLCKYF